MLLFALILPQGLIKANKCCSGVFPDDRFLETDEPQDAGEPEIPVIPAMAEAIQTEGIRANDVVVRDLPTAAMPKDSIAAPRGEFIQHQAKDDAYASRAGSPETMDALSEKAEYFSNTAIEHEGRQFEEIAEQENLILKETTFFQKHND